jgi:hypothetical protein
MKIPIGGGAEAVLAAGAGAGELGLTVDATSATGRVGPLEQDGPIHRPLSLFAKSPFARFTADIAFGQPT